MYVKLCHKFKENLYELSFNQWMPAKYEQAKSHFMSEISQTDIACLIHL